MKWGVDGDIIVYSVAFAAKDDPVEYALKSTRSAVEQIMFDINAEAVEIFLTGKGNYREGLDPAYPYKGNRKSERPEHYAAIKEYMVATLGAIVFEGEEADDAAPRAHFEHVRAVQSDLAVSREQLPAHHHPRRPHPPPQSSIHVVRLVHRDGVFAEGLRPRPRAARGVPRARREDGRGDVHSLFIVPRERLTQPVHAAVTLELLYASCEKVVGTVRFVSAAEEWRVGAHLRTSPRSEACAGRRVVFRRPLCPKRASRTTTRPRRVAPSRTRDAEQH